MSIFSHPFDRKITQAAQEFHFLQMETLDRMGTNHARNGRRCAVW
jgi:hypothetical protein